jgi:cytochrome c oxidase subunit IV
MTDAPVERDERTTAVENAGYRWAYLFLSFGILLIVAFRGATSGQAAWDLMALVVLGGGVHFAFRAFHQALYKRLALRVAIALTAAVLLAAVLVLVRK